MDIVKILGTRNCHSYTYSSFSDDFESKQPPQAGNSGCQDEPPRCSRGHEDPCSNLIPKDSDTELTSKSAPSDVIVPSHQQSIPQNSTGIVIEQGGITSTLQERDGRNWKRHTHHVQSAAEDEYTHHVQSAAEDAKLDCTRSDG